MWTASAILALAALGLVVLARSARLLAFVMALWLAVATLAPASSAAYYQDQARYQVYAIPALCLASSAALLWLVRQQRALAIGLAACWLGCFGWGQSFAAEFLATEQAEVTQLRAWRALKTELPQGAWLAIPIATDGRARTALPDAELLHARPDVRLVNLNEAKRAKDAPLFWFEGLSCAARYPADPPRAATDCLAVREMASLMPVHITAIHPELPDDLATRLDSPLQTLSPWAGDSTQWNPRPFDATPVKVGLYRLQLSE